MITEKTVNSANKVKDENFHNNEGQDGSQTIDDISKETILKHNQFLYESTMEQVLEDSIEMPNGNQNVLNHSQVDKLHEEMLED